MKDIERSNGFKINFGETAKKLDDLEQKIITEKIQHENRIDLINQGKELNEYITSQKSILRKSFTNDFGILGADDSPEKAVEAQKEYDTRMDKYLKLNPDASREEKLDYAGDLTNLLKDKYQDIDIEKFSTFNLERNKFELVSETKQITNSVKIYQEYTSNPRGFIEKSDNPEAAMEIIKGIESKAKLNGYVDEKGNGDVFAFYNRFIEIVENRNPE